MSEKIADNIFIYVCKKILTVKGKKELGKADKKNKEVKFYIKTDGLCPVKGYIAFIKKEIRQKFKNNGKIVFLMLKISKGSAIFGTLGGGFVCE